MLSKKEQTRKKKMRDEKRLQKTELQNYQKWLEENRPLCQINIMGCQNIGADTHHLEFGCFGADKNDKSLIVACRSCHEWCHSHKAISKEMFLHVARENWKQYGGSDDE